MINSLYASSYEGSSLRNKNVAVKRIRPYAKDELVAKYALREIKCLKLLKSHPNVNYYFKFQRWH